MLSKAFLSKRKPSPSRTTAGNVTQARFQMHLDVETLRADQPDSVEGLAAITDVARRARSEPDRIIQTIFQTIVKNKGSATRAPGPASRRRERRRRSIFFRAEERPAGGSPRASNQRLS